MTDEDRQINERIARACGWTDSQDFEGVWALLSPGGSPHAYGGATQGIIWEFGPDYLCPAWW